MHISGKLAIIGFVVLIISSMCFVAVPSVAFGALAGISFFVFAVSFVYYLWKGIHKWSD